MAVQDTTSTEVDSDVQDNDDVSLEDIEVTEEELQAAEDTDDTSESEEETADEETTDDEAEEVEATEESEEETEDEQTEEQKAAAFRAEMYERRQQEKEARQRTQQEGQQQYLDEAQDEQDLALRQLQIDAYDNKVERNTNNLTNSYERAIKDFDIFTNPSPEIQAELDDAIDSFQAKFVKVDEYGNPTEVKADMYAYLQSKADNIAKLTGLKAKAQVQNKSKEKSKAFKPPSRSPKEPKVDPELQAFNEEAYS